MSLPLQPAGAGSKVEPFAASKPDKRDEDWKGVGPGFAVSCASTVPVLSADMSADAAKAQALGMKPWMTTFQKKMPALPVDKLSNAEPQKAVTTHLVWNVAPDFEKKQLNAVATYSYVNKL